MGVKLNGRLYAPVRAVIAPIGEGWRKGVNPPIGDGRSARFHRMPPFKAAPVALTAWLVLTSSGSATDNAAGVGDAAYGRGLAIRWCSSCHLVTADQQLAKPGAPPFTTIAQSPDFNADRLARLMLAPHPNMAKLALSRAAIDDIAAYILSLKK
jgi:mono/diheme cytochrome c family protein